MVSTPAKLEATNLSEDMENCDLDSNGNPDWSVHKNKVSPKRRLDCVDSPLVNHSVSFEEVEPLVPITITKLDETPTSTESSAKAVAKVHFLHF